MARNRTLISAAIACVLFCASSAFGQTAPAITIALKPIAAGGEIPTVEVRETLIGYAGSAGKPLLQVPSRVTLTPGQPYRDGDVIATDDLGPLALTMAVEPAAPGYPLEWRTFSPQRDTKGPIQLRYTAAIAPALSPRKPGPSYDLRGAGGGFGGAPWTFVLLPRGPEAPATLK